MAELRRYVTLISDNGRWDGFPFRPDDIVISTPPKAGTTWTQRLCSLLIFDGVELPRPLAEISPWLDMLTTSRDDVFATLAAQEHRRFIKTHTPLDGLPYDDRITYICVGRDPRDLALSWENHLANMDFGALIMARAAAVGLDDLDGMTPPEPPAADPVDRFWQWADAGEDAVGSTLVASLHHIETFWDRRDEPGIALFHFSDLLADLPGQLRRLADVLGIETTDERIAELAPAATFAEMKACADQVAPDVGNRIWLRNADFFRNGSNGQWRDLLDEENLRRYEARVASLVSADLAAWAHQGWLGVTTG